MIGAEQEVQAGRLESPGKILGDRIGYYKPRAEQGEDPDGADKRQTDPALPGVLK